VLKNPTGHGSDRHVLVAGDHAPTRMPGLAAQAPHSYKTLPSGIEHVLLL
jgi:hypothetical protein